MSSGARLQWQADCSPNKIKKTLELFLKHGERAWTKPYLMHGAHPALLDFGERYAEISNRFVE